MTDSTKNSDTPANAVTEPEASDHAPRISPNPATNLLVFEVLVGAITRFSRDTAGKALLGKQFDPQTAKKAAKQRSKTQKLATLAASKVASRSLPGFALVSTGLIAKTLFDRSQNRRKALAKGNTAPRELSDPED